MSFSVTFTLDEVGSQQASDPPVSATTVLLLQVDKIRCSCVGAGIKFSPGAKK